jgi:hypothetical protein
MDDDEWDEWDGFHKAFWYSRMPAMKSAAETQQVLALLTSDSGRLDTEVARLLWNLYISELERRGEREVAKGVFNIYADGKWRGYATEEFIGHIVERSMAMAEAEFVYRLKMVREVIIEAGKTNPRAAAVEVDRLIELLDRRIELTV